MFYSFRKMNWFLLFCFVWLKCHLFVCSKNDDSLNSTIIPTIHPTYFFQRFHHTYTPTSQPTESPLIYLMNPIEYEVLFDIYNSTNGKEWKLPSDSVGWDFSKPLSNKHSPCKNDWHGIICYHIQLSEYVIFQTIVSLALDSLDLIGTFPSSIIKLTNLTQLSITFNHKLIGPIPFHTNNTGIFPQLEFLTIQSNGFTGSLPSIIFTLPNLYFLHISNNPLNSSLPNNTKLSVFLSFILLDNNNLTGTIPKTLFQENCSLTHLDLSFNQLTKQIPSSITHCNKISEIFLTSNRFTGSFPYLLTQLPSLSALSVAQNSFFGEINSYEFPLKHFPSPFIDLDISSNLFSGSLPTIFYSTKSFRTLLLSHNLFVGTISSNISNLQAIKQLDLSYNSFSGTLNPIFLAYFPGLKFLGLNHNHFDGSFPIVKSTIHSIQDILLDHNYLTGEITSFFNSISYLLFLSLNHNYFIGSIPFKLFSLPSLMNLFLHENHFTGSIPSLQTLKKKKQYAKSLGTLDISKNHLTGKIPWDLFVAQDRMSSLSISTNCFDLQSIPMDVCNITFLQSFVLNGLFSGCSSIPWNNNMNNLWIQQPSFSFASCIFTMSWIQEIYASDNQLIGTFPPSIAPNLITISLRNNRFSGNIPITWQNKSDWQLFDVSNNRLNGLLIETIDLNPETIWNINQNHISGNLPLGTIQNNSHVNILQDNLFDCHNYQTNHIFDHDPIASTYQCGSNNINLIVYLWICGWIGSILVIGIRWLVKKRKTNQIEFISMYKLINHELIHYLLSHCKDYPLLSHYIHTLFLWQQSLYWFGGCVCLFFLSLYGYLHISHSLYQQVYVYFISSVFLSGSLSGYILCFCWGLLILIWSYFTNQCHANTTNYHISLQETKQILTYSTVLQSIYHKELHKGYSQWEYWKRYGPWILLYLVMILITFCLSSLTLLCTLIYLNSQIHSSRTYQYFFQISFSLYFLCIIDCLIPWIVDIMSYWCIPISKAKIWFESKRIFFELYLTFLITIIEPTLILIFYDNHCLYHQYFSHKNPIMKQFMQTTCQNFQVFRFSIDSCFEYENSISYENKYVYSYQCSSSMFISYWKVFGFMLMIEVFFFPLLRFCFHNIHFSINFIQKTWISSHGNQQRWLISLIFYFTLLLTYGLMFPIAILMIVWILMTTIRAQFYSIYTLIQSIHEQESSSSTSSASSNKRLYHFMKALEIKISEVIPSLLWVMIYLLIPWVIFFSSWFIMDIFDQNTSIIPIYLCFSVGLMLIHILFVIFTEFSISPLSFFLRLIPTFLVFSQQKSRATSTRQFELIPMNISSSANNTSRVIEDNTQETSQLVHLNHKGSSHNEIDCEINFLPEEKEEEEVEEDIHIIQNILVNNYL